MDNELELEGLKKLNALCDSCIKCVSDYIANFSKVKQNKKSINKRHLGKKGKDLDPKAIYITYAETYKHACVDVSKFQLHPPLYLKIFENNREHFLKILKDDQFLDYNIDIHLGKGTKIEGSNIRIMFSNIIKIARDIREHAEKKAKNDEDIKKGIHYLYLPELKFRLVDVITHMLTIEGSKYVKKMTKIRDSLEREARLSKDIIDEDMGVAYTDVLKDVAGSTMSSFGLDAINVQNMDTGNVNKFLKGVVNERVADGITDFLIESKTNNEQITMDRFFDCLSPTFAEIAEQTVPDGVDVDKEVVEERMKANAKQVNKIKKKFGTLAEIAKNVTDISDDSDSSSESEDSE